MFYLTSTHIVNMRLTSVLQLKAPAFQLSKIMLFTRPNCGLCESAKGVLNEVRSNGKDFDYEEVDITEDRNKKWFDLYAYDVPVIHVENGKSSMKKFMHRLDKQDVSKALEDQ